MKELLNQIKSEIKLSIKELSNFHINENNLDYCKNEIELLSCKLLNTSKKIECISNMDKIINKWKKISDNPYSNLGKNKKSNASKEFTKDEILYIRNSTSSAKTLAFEFDVTPLTIYNIKNRKFYKYI